MSRGVGIALLVTLLAATLSGCRTVWVHPEATAEKYANDLFFCRYGMERVAWQAAQSAESEDSAAQAPAVATATAVPDRSWALGAGDVAPGPIRPGWKRCMVNLGWTSSTSGRSDPPWRTPRPPRRPARR